MYIYTNITDKLKSPMRIFNQLTTFNESLTKKYYIIYEEFLFWKSCNDKIVKQYFVEVKKLFFYVSGY